MTNRFEVFVSIDSFPPLFINQKCVDWLNVLLFFLSTVLWLCQGPFCKHTTPNQIPRGHERFSSRNPCSDDFPNHLYSKFLLMSVWNMINRACYTRYNRSELTLQLETSKILNNTWQSWNNQKTNFETFAPLCLKCSLKRQPPFARKVTFLVRKGWYFVN